MSENKENNKEQEVEAKQPEAKQEKDLNKLSQTHGKTEEFRPTTLDQIWGDTGAWKYQTMDESEYRGMLENMPRSDLTAHASKIGLIPIDDRNMLIGRLMGEFKKHVSTYRNTQSPTQSGPLPPEVEKILKEGR
jgi:hypothetical protein